MVELCLSPYVPCCCPYRTLMTFCPHISTLPPATPLVHKQDVPCIAMFHCAGQQVPPSCGGLFARQCSALALRQSTRAPNKRRASFCATVEGKLPSQFPTNFHWHPVSSHPVVPASLPSNWLTQMVHVSPLLCASSPASQTPSFAT